jgi:hypothetical protein
MIFIFNNNNIEEDEIKIISETIKKYNIYFNDVCNSPIGKYSINSIIQTVEESLNYLEACTPVLKKWVHDYLGKNRGKLWLYYGITKGSYLTDYWKISETNFKELQEIWPFLYNRTTPEYKGFIIDINEAQNNIIKQRERQDKPNPNYKSFHPDGCSSGCSCWMLDHMEQWYTEEQEEIRSSNNIFFNTKLQSDFYKAALEDLEELKEEWTQWEPKIPSSPSCNSKSALTLDLGLTPIKIAISWIKSDFYYNRIFLMFSFSDFFKEIWENIDSVSDFIKIQREKLKNILELL